MYGAPVSARGADVIGGDADAPRCRTRKRLLLTQGATQH